MMTKFLLFVLVFSSLFIFSKVSQAEEPSILPLDKTNVAVVSTSNITEETAGRYLDEQLALEARLKYYLAGYLRARGLKVVSSIDDQKNRTASYVLAYKIEYAEAGKRHPNISVGYSLEKNSGEVLAAGETKVKSVKKRAVRRTSVLIADAAADAIEGRKVVSPPPKTPLTDGENTARIDEKMPERTTHEKTRDNGSFVKRKALGLDVSGIKTDADDDYGYSSLLSYEISLFRHWSTYAKFGYIAYQIDDGLYSETARGFGPEIGVRFYPGKERLQGWYLGLGVGQWRIEGTWKDGLGTPFETSGKGKTRVNFANLHAGYKILLSSPNFYLEPGLRVDEYGGNSGKPGGFGRLGVSLSGVVGAGIIW